MGGILWGGTAKLTVDLDQPGAKVSPEPADWQQWLPKYAEAVKQAKTGPYVEGAKSYRLSFHARCTPGFKGPLTVSIEKQDGTVLASQPFEGIGDKWKKHEALLTVRETDPDARLVLSASREGTLWLDMVSLFPKDTYQGRMNGLRPDLMKMLEDMHPAFVRLPGGCFIEGWKPFHLKDIVSGLKKTAKGQDLILKVVNIAAVPYDTALDLRNAGRLAATGEALVLQADRVDAENSFEKPLDVVPATTKLTGIAPGFRHPFPPNSVPVLRLGVER